MKARTFYIMYNVGTAKYIVNFHDGVKQNKDGSDFYDIAIFHNKKKLKLFTDELTRLGYREV